MTSHISDGRNSWGRSARSALARDGSCDRAGARPVSDCCNTPNDRGKTTANICPSCGRKAQPVAVLTVKSLAIDHARVNAESSYFFCRTPDCSVVYFSNGYAFHKSDLKVRVGLKETEDPVPLCYCFGYAREDLRREIEVYGTSEIPGRIKAEVQAGFCACEVKNPSGNCCLGEVNRAVVEMKTRTSPAAK